MIGVHVDPQGKNSSLHWIDAAAPSDCSGLVIRSFDTTNTDTRTSLSSTLPRRTRVDRGIEYAMTHYEDLLRRLAD